MLKRENIGEVAVRSADLPRRRGTRPKTIRAPLHFQCNGHGNPKYLNELIQEIRSWPDIEANPPSIDQPDTLSICLEGRTIAQNANTFIAEREIARVLLGAPTIYLALPLVTAHWAIVRGWAEPHYLGSHGLMPAGVVVLYTPRDEEERAVCYSLFAQTYECSRTGQDQISDSDQLLSYEARPSRETNF
jgi:hypothetical protein